MAKSRSYDETLKESLSDPEEAAAYLNAALEEGDPAVFVLALKDVANVHNLDVIISVGYRIKSQRGVRFRQWVTRVLGEHLTQGDSLNEPRLVQPGLAEL